MRQPVRDHAAAPPVTLRRDQPVSAAIDALRERERNGRITYFYVVDDDERLLGVVPTRRLLLAGPNMLIEQVMHSPVVSVREDASMHEVMHKLHEHQFLALPVVDDGGRLMGVIDASAFIDEAEELAESQRLKDLYQVMGVRVAQVREGSVLAGFRLRMPWLAVNIAGGLACAVVATQFEGLLEKVVIIAAFIPLVLAIAASIAIQALTLSLSQVGQGGGPRLGRLAWKEIRTAALLGLACGGIVGTVALLFGDGAGPSVIIGASIVGAMMISSMLGTWAPVLLHALRLDPNVAAGPVVLTLNDILALTLYLTAAAVALS